MIYFIDRVATVPHFIELCKRAPQVALAHLSLSLSLSPSSACYAFDGLTLCLDFPASGGRNSSISVEPTTINTQR